MSETLLKPITAERQPARGWQVRVNGALLQDVSLLILEHGDIGTLTYGDTPAGYDSWAFRHACGGVVILPFCFIDDALVVGLVREHRFNQGGDVWNAPRGFLERGESAEDGAIRELSEETGYEFSGRGLVSLPGPRGNPNSAFFDTRSEDRGMAFFALEVSRDELERDEKGYVFREGRVDRSEAALQHRVAEQIGDVHFLRWEEAACVGDMFTNAIVARLLAWLRSHDERGGAQTRIDPRPPRS
ncbi:NUDIX domain-containing protein [Polyangium mundeleinium]|uniref:NUDIX domain-containing protein n=1 Tax=Polyangium mundeleinium TaxID=2995306 RepID=A0ABT5ENJ7_9BACT|nr:NUDIX domain-containing protein [Polyangium mundeleinium]MDC0742942.1 NUDIX domain-containing protein [Polyangium mundeleinium]